MLAECFQTMLYSLETTLKIDNWLGSYSLYTKFKTSLHTLDCAHCFFPNGLSYSLYFDVWTRNGVFLHIPPPAKADLVSASRKMPPVALPARADLSSSETHVAFTLKTAGSTFYAKPKEGHQFGPTRCSSQSNSTKACATRLSPARYWSFTPSR